MKGCTNQPIVSILRLGLSLVSILLASQVLAASSDPLRFGLTSVFVIDQPGLLREWRGYLQDRLGRPVQFVRRRTYAEITDMLLDGRLDAAWICTFPYVSHADRLSLLVVPLYHGRPLYRSYIIVPASDRHSRSILDLQGEVFAYVEPRSNSGYVYPRYRLMRAGQDPDAFFLETFFTWSHPDLVWAVAEGLADGGAVDGYVWDSLARTDPTLTVRTRVLERSPAFGFPPIVTRQGLPEPLRARLRAIFLGMEDDPRGQALLHRLNLDGFIIAGEGLYDSARRMAGQIQGGD